MRVWRNEMQVRSDGPKCIMCTSQIAHPFFQCLDAEGKPVATYRATAMAISKDGELRIYPV